MSTRGELDDARGLAPRWEAEQDAISDRIVAGWEELVRHRGALRAAALLAARDHDVERAREHELRLRFEVLLRPATDEVEQLLAPLDTAVAAYVDFVDGRLENAEAKLVSAIADHGQLAVRHGFALRHATQLHLCGHLIRVLAARGDTDRAVTFGEDVLAAAGDRHRWPLEGVPVEPWKQLPEAIGLVLRGQIERALTAARHVDESLPYRRA